MAEVSLNLDRRDPIKDKSYPIKIIIYHQGNNRRYGLKKKTSVTEEEWEKMFSMNLKNEKLKDIKKYAESEKSRAEKIIESLGNDFTFELFKDFYLEKKVPSKSDVNQNKLWEIWENRIKNLKANEQFGSATNDECALKSFRKFNPDLNLRKITVDILKDYEKWMISNDSTATTISMYVRVLRKILNIAKDDKLITEEMYPFGKKTNAKKTYDIPKGINTKKAIKIDFLKVLKEAECKTDEQQFAKDMWFFSFYCNGMNMVDIFSLKYKDIQDDFFHFLRKKTSKTQKTPQLIEVFIPEEVSEIIDKWGNKNKSGNNYVFNVFTNNMSAEERFQVKKIKFVQLTIL